MSSNKGNKSKKVTNPISYAQAAAMGVPYYAQAAPATNLAPYVYPGAQAAPYVYPGTQGAPYVYPPPYPLVKRNQPPPRGLTVQNLGFPVGLALGALGRQPAGYHSGAAGLGALAGHAAVGAVDTLARLPNVVETVGAAGNCLGTTAGCLLQGGKRFSRKSKRKALRKKTYRKSR